MYEYEVVSADAHIEAPPTRWTDRLPANLRDSAPQVIEMPDGGQGVSLGDEAVPLGLTITGGLTYDQFRQKGLRYDDGPPGTGEPSQRIAEQDRAILKSARSLKGELELHLYPGGDQGWCLTWKEPLFDRKRAVIGLVGLSRDVRPANTTPGETRALSAALRHVQDHPETPVAIGDLAARAGLSAFQFDQRIRAMFGLSAGQYLTRLRIERASERLRRSEDPIAEIALDCGYADQTAFTRQFRKVVGLSPGQYRKLKT